jgi:hypothetical protein
VGHLRWRVIGVVAVVALAVLAGGWLGVRSVSRPPLPAVGVTPMPAGAPERIEPLRLPVSGEEGLGSADAVLTADGRTLVTIGADGRLSVADLVAGRVDQVATGTSKPESARGTGYSQERHALALASDGRTIWVTDGWGRRVQAVDLVTRAVVDTVVIPAVPTAIAVAGDTVAVGDATGAVTILQATTARQLAFLDIAPGPVAQLTASPDGRRIVVAADPGGDYGPGSVIAVDLTDPRAPSMPYSWPVTRPRGLGGTSILVSPDGRRAYVVTGPRLGPAAPDADTVGGVAVLDLDAGREVTNIPAPHTSGLALSPDGQRLYLARDTEVALPSAPDPELVLDALDITAITRTATTPGSDIDSGPPAQLIGSLTDPASSTQTSVLLAAPDHHRLYALGEGVTVIDLRAS